MISDNEIKGLFRLCVLQNSSQQPLAAPPACLELTSGSGVILERTAREEVEKYVIGGPLGNARTSIFEIASELLLEPRVIERLLPSKNENWGRVGNSVVLRKHEYARLKGMVESEIENGVVQIPEFCRRNQIDEPLFRRLLSSKNGSWSWLGQDMSNVYGCAFYDKIREQIKETLKEANKPKKFIEIFPDRQLPFAFISKIVSDLMKCRDIMGHVAEGAFVPEIYLRTRQTELMDELRTEGIIGLEALIAEGVAEPENFVTSRIPDAILLVHHFAAPKFLAQIESMVMDKVESQEWCDVKDPENRLSKQDEEILWKYLSRNMPDYVIMEGRFVHKDLQTKLKQLCQKLAFQKAETAWKKRSKETSSLKWQDVSRHLSSGRSFPTALLSHLTNNLHPYSLSQFTRRIEQLQRIEFDSAKSVFMEKYALRYLVNREGLRSIGDKSLRSKLGVDLLQFARDNGISALEKLENTLFDSPDTNLQHYHVFLALLKNGSSDGKTEERLNEIDKVIPAFILSMNAEVPQEDAILRRKRGIMGELSMQLQNATEISLQLLLVIILLHASHKAGVIRASGKNVPKLLKEVQNLNILTDEQVKLLNSAKSAAMGKQTISKAETEALKELGVGCLHRAQEKT